MEDNKTTFFLPYKVIPIRFDFHKRWFNSVLICVCGPFLWSGGLEDVSIRDKKLFGCPPHLLPGVERLFQKYNEDLFWNFKNWVGILLYSKNFFFRISKNWSRGGGGQQNNFFFWPDKVIPIRFDFHKRWFNSVLICVCGPFLWSGGCIH